MSREIIIRCNRCDTSFEEGTTGSTAGGNVSIMTELDEVEEDFDLCPACAKDFEEFLNGGVVVPANGG